jgi:hypothetical protein
MDWGAEAPNFWESLLGVAPNLKRSEVADNPKVTGTARTMNVA